MTGPAGRDAAARPELRDSGGSLAASQTGGGTDASQIHGSPSHRPELSATVVICAYSERRWELLTQAVAEVSRQLRPGDELLVVIDHAPQLLGPAKSRFTDARILANAHDRGLSGARNTAVEAADTDVIVFLDDDAVPGPGWLEALLAPYRDDRVIGVGGYIAPVWPGAAPWWFPEEFLWVVGCSYAGLPTGEDVIRNPIGASMSFRRAVFARAGLFASSLGRVGTVPTGCEETELSIRAAQHFTAGRIVHQPGSVVRHHVSEDRTTFAYFRHRCWSEGVSKASVRQEIAHSRAFATERTYVVSTLRKAILRELRAAVRGDAQAATRAAVVVAGAVLTAGGYVTRLLGQARSR